MAELLAEGGCYNCMRFAVDGAGANLRTWRGAIDTDQEFLTTETLILACSFDGDDMNSADNATFKIQWRNITDSGSWTDLAATGEMKWATSSDLTDGNSVASAAYADSPSSIDCTGKGWTVEGTGEESEGANQITYTAADDELHELHWAIALDSAGNGDQYEFRVVQSNNTVIGTGSGKITVGIPGKIEGVTKDSDRGSVVGSVIVSAYKSDGASPPKPTGSLVQQTTSNASTGAYTLSGQGLFSGIDYFLHFYKDDTNDLSDGSPVVTAVAL